MVDVKYKTKCGIRTHQIHAHPFYPPYHPFQNLYHGQSHQDLDCTIQYKLWIYVSHISDLTSYNTTKSRKHLTVASPGQEYQLEL